MGDEETRDQTLQVFGEHSAINLQLSFTQSHKYLSSSFFFKDRDSLGSVREDAPNPHETGGLREFRGLVWCGGVGRSSWRRGTGRWYGT